MKSGAPNLQMRTDLAALRDSTHLAGPQLSPRHAHLGDPALAGGPALFSAPHVPPHVPARRGLSLLGTLWLHRLQPRKLRERR